MRAQGLSLVEVYAARNSAYNDAVGRGFARPVALAALSVTAAAPAQAQADDSDKAMAQALFEDGTKLLGEGQTDAACAKLASSQRLDPQIGTLLYLATCHEKQLKTATAWAEFNEGLAELEHAPNQKREAYTRAHLAALGARLSRLVLTTQANVQGLEVKVDGRTLDAGMLGTPLPVDPGSHKIEAVAPRHKPGSTTVDVGAGPVDVPVVVPAPEALPAASTASTTTTTATARPEQPPVEGGSGRTAGYVVGGIGIAGLALGAVGGLVAISDKSKADGTHCDSTGHCDTQGLTLYDDARTWSWVSNVAFGVGVVGVGVATYLLLFRSDPQRAVTGVRLSPTLGGLSMSGAW